MGLINYHRECRVCKHIRLRPIFDLGEHYLHGLFVFPDFQPPTGKIPTLLTQCDTRTGGCGLVQLKHSVDPDILYSRYGYRSSTNATMRAHLTQIALDADTLWLKHHPDGNPVCLDIGCNDGFLSRQLPNHYKKYGVDPCDVGNSISGIENFTFVNDIFPSLKLGGRQFNIITMIACFYDLNDPIAVAKQLRSSLTNDGILVVEVSYWPDKMAQNAIDEVCHEHVCFYNFQNLEDIFTKAGFNVVNVVKNNINGGSIQLWLTPDINTLPYKTPAANRSILAVKFDELNQRLDSPKPYEEFESRCDEVKEEILNLFSEFKRNNKTVHLYGASTKGNVLLQYLGLDSNDIPYAAERSKEKHGGTTLGTNIKMISEEESRSMRPDYYFVPIWSFRDEIIRREQSFINGGGKLIFPLPKIEIIGN
jgi:SAM-dependent methyltransferase